MVGREKPNLGETSSRGRHDQRAFSTGEEQLSPFYSSPSDFDGPGPLGPTCHWIQPLDAIPMTVYNSEDESEQCGSMLVERGSSPPSESMIFDRKDVTLRLLGHGDKGTSSNLAPLSPTRGLALIGTSRPRFDNIAPIRKNNKNSRSTHPKQNIQAVFSQVDKSGLGSAYPPGGCREAPQYPQAIDWKNELDGSAIQPPSINTSLSSSKTISGTDNEEEYVFVEPSEEEEEEWIKI